MSWGFLVDLDITVPTQAWKVLKAERPRDVSLARGWSGLVETSLEEAFGRPYTGDDTFAKVLKWKWGPESIVLHEPVGDRTRIRVCVVLEKSQLDHAFPLAALLEAARTVGGAGSLRFVNDGTSGAEDGSQLTLADGTIEATPLEAYEDHLDALTGELFKREATRSAKPMINPFTGKPIVGKPTTKKPR